MAEQTLEHETDETDNTSWVDVFNSIDQLLQTINEKQDDGNIGIAFYEASLILNKLETALSIVVRSMTYLDIDLSHLTENTRLVLLQFSSSRSSRTSFGIDNDGLP